MTEWSRSRSDLWYPHTPFHLPGIAVFRPDRAVALLKPLQMPPGGPVYSFMPKRIAACPIREPGNDSALHGNTRLQNYGAMQAGELLTVLRVHVPGTRTRAQQIMVLFTRFKTLAKEIIAAKGCPVRC